MNQRNTTDPDDMRPEYDFSGGVRGKHHEQYRAGTNVVFLDADVAKAFKDSESANRALRLPLTWSTSCHRIGPHKPEGNTVTGNTVTGYWSLTWKNK